MKAKLKQKLRSFQTSSLHEVVDFRIPVSTVGPSGRLTVPNLVRLLQEAAMRNTVRLRVSSPELIAAHGLSWILRRQRIECFHLPEIGREVKVITAPTGFARRLQTFRDFHLIDAATDEHLAVATTQWLLMDINSRRLRPIPERIASLSTHFAPAAAHLSPPLEKIVPPTAADRHHRTTVAYHQLDFNNHMTNPVFPELMLEPLGGDFLRAHYPAVIDIDYRAEAHYGDHLTAVAETETGGFRHALLRNDQLLATMTSSWTLNDKPAPPEG